MKQGLVARLAAATMLAAVVDRQVPLDALVDAATGPEGERNTFQRLSARDRALARAVVTVALRRRGAIERGLARFLDRPLPRRARQLHHLLHVAAAQIVFMDVPDRAAIDLAVDAAKGDTRSERFAGLVNAVLRRVAGAGDEIRALPPAPEDVPPWLWKAWRRDYGRDKALRIVAALRDEPLLDLSLKAPDAERPEGFALANGTWRVLDATTPVPGLAGYSEGGWWVQDAAAALPVALLGAVKGRRVLDMCAAPGGKTAQLAARGAHVTALDRAPGRVERLRNNLDRLGLRADVMVADALEYEPPAGTEGFDAVLLDAPCSSLGTLRRHPDVVWTKTEADVAALAELQERLLERACRLVRPGGTVVFANCSLMKREGEDVWRRFREGAEGVEPAPVEPAEVFALPAVTGAGTLRTLPFHGFPASDGEATRERAAGMDGFFAARFRAHSTDPTSRAG